MQFPARPPVVDVARLGAGVLPRILGGAFSPVLPDGRYLHWDQLRNRQPPAGLTREQWWLSQKLARRSNGVNLPLADSEGRPFWFCRLDAIDRATHELDRRDAAKEIVASLRDESSRHHYRTEQLIEEAINSSVVEGAKLTTRAQAKAMIRDGRRPSSRGERMVVNNYNAMLRLLEVTEQPLGLDDLLEIHAILGEQALDATDDAAGRLRLSREKVRVEDARTGEVWFTPPPAAELPAQLEQLLAFANEPATAPGNRFVHPLLRAIILHFWLAYLHPFVDGNGRMARALFYWQMLRSGYDFAQYLSISGPIDRSPRSYYLAFVHTETDGGDLTYFLLHQLAVLRRATDELIAHLCERTRQLGELATAMDDVALNHRQQAVLAYLVRNPHPGMTIRGHAGSHDVTYLTARRDLQELERQGYLRRVRSGRSEEYLPTKDLGRRLAPVTGAVRDSARRGKG